MGVTLLVLTAAAISFCAGFRLAVVLDGPLDIQLDRGFALSRQKISSGECACSDSPPGPICFTPETEYRFERMVDNDFELRYVRVYAYGAYHEYSEEVFSSHFFVVLEMSA